MPKARIDCGASAPGKKEAAYPADYDKSIVSAVQAMAEGSASPAQQVQALKWIVERASGCYDVSYRSDPYETAFAEGKRFVGLQIVKLTKINLLTWKEDNA